MQLLVVNGHPEAGKDTFVDFCLDYLKGRSRKVSTIDFCKELASDLGWNGEKTPLDRWFLANLKRLLTVWKDIPYKETIKEIKAFENVMNFYGYGDKSYVFVMCREPEEIERFKKEFNAQTILIQRDSMKNIEYSNEADRDVDNLTYDYIIRNDGDLELLQNKAKVFVDILENL